jgi:excisionase family DNA binding protein
METNNPDRPEFVLTETEAARALSLGVSTLRRMRARGEIAFVKAGRHRVLYRASHLSEYLNRHERLNVS